MKRQRQSYWLCVGVLWLVMMSHTLWRIRLPDNPIRPVDAAGYHQMALNVLGGHGLSLRSEAPFCPTALRMPLYPLFVTGCYAVFGSHPEIVIMVQVLLEMLTTAFVIRLGKELRTVRVGALAGLIYALNGTTQRFSGYLLTEPLLLPVMACALWLTVRYLQYPSTKRTFLVALCWGMAVLIKPNALILTLCVIVGCIVCAWHRLTARVVVRIVLAFGLIFVALLTPWLVRNHHVLGRWTLTTAFEEAFMTIMVSHADENTTSQDLSLYQIFS